MKALLKIALSLVESCLTDYCETNIESDVDMQEELNKAWQLIKRSINHE